MGAGRVEESSRKSADIERLKRLVRPWSTSHMFHVLQNNNIIFFTVYSISFNV